MDPRRVERPFRHATGSTAQNPAQSKLILEEVLRETITGLSSVEWEACRGDLANMSQNEARKEFNEQAAKVLVRFATPLWARQLVADEQSWLALTSETTRILFIDDEIRARLERIWSRIGE